jgi:ferrous iron transport protein A
MSNHIQNITAEQNAHDTGTLDRVAPGSRCRVVRMGLKGPLRRRLMDMGVITGADIEIVRVAPLGDPMELKIKGYLLSLRKEDAQYITVEIVESRSHGQSK